MNITLSKYAVAILQIAALLIQALVAITVLPSTVAGWWVFGLQLTVVLAGAVATYWVPLVGPNRSGWVKVVVSVVVAAATAVIPLVGGEFTYQAFMTVVVAAFTAFMTGVGVAVRRDADPTIESDPKADGSYNITSLPEPAAVGAHAGAEPVSVNGVEVDPTPGAPGTRFKDV